MNTDSLNYCCPLDPNKYNTISVVKLSETASKEKIGRSTFYKSSLPIDSSNKILPYAQFSDLDAQVPLEVRRERMRKLSLIRNNTLDNSSSPNGTEFIDLPRVYLHFLLGNSLSFHQSSYPETPLVLYSSPLNIPVEEHYKLVDPKPRPVRSAYSAPDQLNVTDGPIYNQPSNLPVDLDYQHPLNYAEVVSSPTQGEGQCLYNYQR